jgi:3-keto-5-aminohexanoate cleavage enzyme
MTGELSVALAPASRSHASVLLVLGRYTPGHVSSPEDLAPLVDAPRRPVAWFICAFGPQEMACALAAA